MQVSKHRALDRLAILTASFFFSSSNHIFSALGREVSSYWTVSVTFPVDMGISSSFGGGAERGGVGIKLGALYMPGKYCKAMP